MLWPSLVALMFGVLMLPSFAQDTPLAPEFDVSTTVIGRPVALRLRLPPDIVAVQASAWPPSPIYELLATPSFTPTDLSQPQELVWQLVFWQPGLFIAPEQSLSLASGQTIPISAASIQVASSLGTDYSLRPDIAPITLNVPANPLWLGLWSFSLLMASSLFLWRFWQQKRYRALVMADSVLAAEAQLADLLAQDLPADAKLELANRILRAYLQHRYAIASLELTSTEIFAVLRQQNQLNRPGLLQLRSLLEQMDLLKFADQPLSPDKLNGFIQAALAWVLADRAGRYA